MLATEGYHYKNQSMDAVALPPATAFSNASGALDEARSLAFGVADLLDRLCGSQPAEVMDKSKPTQGSVLASLREDAERTADAVRRAVSQLNRLERELPS